MEVGGRDDGTNKRTVALLGLLSDDPGLYKTKGGGDDSDSESDDDDDMDDDNECTLRKCSAASLDALSGMFGANNILPPLLPALQEGLGHSDLWVREASILALGAIADGCKDKLTPHMPQLHPFLLQQLVGPESLMTDPIVCAVDLIDGLAEGLGPNFGGLVNGSARFGPTFASMLQGCAEHFTAG